MDERIRPGLEDAQEETLRLRRFGRGLSIMLALLGLLAWRRGRIAKAEGEAAAALISLAVAQFFPRAIKPFEKAWMPVAKRLEKINTLILMGAAYYLFLTPYALVCRARGSDVLDEKLKTGQSYWKSKKRSDGLESYTRQF